MRLLFAAWPWNIREKKFPPIILQAGYGIYILICCILIKEPFFGEGKEDVEDGYWFGHNAGA